MIKLSTLKKNPNNPRQITAARLESLKKSIQDFERMMALRPMVVDETNTVLGGNMRLAALRGLGYKEVPDEWVMRAEGLTDAEKREFVIKDNNGWGEYDWDTLGAEWDDLPLADWGVDVPADWAGEEESAVGGGGDEYDTTPDEEQTRVQHGDVWQIGRHRIACLDSLKAESYTKLLRGETPQMVWSDPPYGIAVVNTRSGADSDSAAPGFKNSKGKVGVTGVTPAGVYAPIIGDETSDTAKVSFAIAYEKFSAAVHVWWGGNFYASSLPDSPHWVMWDKMTDANQFADGELAWTNQTGALRTFRHQWMGMLRASERGEKRVHPTQKPVALAVWCFEKYGNKGDLILDPFLGSGMSVIAAERTGRRVYGLELSPKYVNVILSRFEAETGQQAELIERDSKEIG